MATRIQVIQLTQHNAFRKGDNELIAFQKALKFARQDPSYSILDRLHEFVVVRPIGNSEFAKLNSDVTDWCITIESNKLTPVISDTEYLESLRA